MWKHLFQCAAQCAQDGYNNSIFLPNENIAFHVEMGHKGIKPYDRFFKTLIDHLTIKV